MLDTIDFFLFLQIKIDVVNLKSRTMTQNQQRKINNTMGLLASVTAKFRREGKCSIFSQNHSSVTRSKIICRTLPSVEPQDQKASDGHKPVLSTTAHGTYLSSSKAVLSNSFSYQCLHTFPKLPKYHLCRGILFCLKQWARNPTKTSIHCTWSDSIKFKSTFPI